MDLQLHGVADEVLADVFEGRDVEHDHQVDERSWRVVVEDVERLLNAVAVLLGEVRALVLLRNNINTITARTQTSRSCFRTQYFAWRLMDNSITSNRETCIDTAILF